VDDIDLDILRWMYPGGVFSFWGVDPRITPTEIASHVGLDRTAVWDRLRKWKREGFWNGYEVTLNLTTLGQEEVRVEIQVADSAEGSALLGKLEHVDGALWARACFGDTITERNVEVVVVVLVGDDPAHLERRLRSLRQLAPTGVIGGPFRDDSPPCTRDLTPLDWRVIAAIVANPNASPSRVARLLGVTRKTLVRHHSSLIDSHAVFYVPKVDWARLGCVALELFCDDPEAVDRVRRAVEARFPHAIPWALRPRSEGINAGWDNSTCFVEIVPAHSPHEVQTIVRDLSMIAGVRKVRPEYWGPERRFPRWVNQRIAEHLARPAPTVPIQVVRSSSRETRGHSTSPRRGVSS
jgi:DNA-binding Lrp family transcriptional regulator